MSRAVIDLPPGAIAVVREACVCGVDVIATGRTSDEVLEAVQRHNVEPVHERWAALAGFRGPLAEQYALMQVADEMAAAQGRVADPPVFRGRPTGYRSPTAVLTRVG